MLIKILFFFINAKSEIDILQEQINNINLEK